MATSNLKSIFGLLAERYKYLILLLSTACYMVIMYTNEVKLPLGHLFFLLIIASLLILYYPSSARRRFLLMIGVFGTLSVFYSPIHDIPDEYVHYARSLFLSEGDLNLSNDQEQLQVSEDIKIIDDQAGKSILKDQLNLTKHTNREVVYPTVKMTNAYYSISYLPQALGLWLGNRLNLPVSISYYLGRLANLLVYLFLIYWALKLSGSYEQVIGVIAMNPMAIYLAASYNQDGFAIGLILLVISLFLKMIQAQHISYSQLLLYYLLCALLVVTKFPYLLLVFLPLFLRAKEEENGLEMLISKILLTLSVLLAAFIWYTLYNQIQSPKLASFLEKVNSGEQLNNIFSNLSLYGRIIFRTMFENLINLKDILTYGPLTYGTSTSFNLYFAYLILVYINNLGRIRVSKILKFTILLVILGISGMITLALYLTWTPVGDKTILGIQSRYFIGLLPLFYLLLTSDKKPAQQLVGIVSEQKIINLGVIFILSMLMATVLQYY